MKRFFWSLFTFCLLVGASDLRAESEEVTKAREFVNDLLTLGKLSKQKTGETQPEAKALVAKLSAGVDFEGLAAKSLRGTWSGLGEEKQKDFMDTLQGMIEEVLFPRAHRISAPLNEVEFSLHPKNLKRVKAKTRFETEKHGEIVERDLEIDLIYAESGSIEDAWIEGELVSSNLQRQFDNALKKKTFDQILAQMKSRLKKARGSSTESTAAEAASEGEASKDVQTSSAES